jgi:hypothetical protein
MLAAAGPPLGLGRVTTLAAMLPVVLVLCCRSGGDGHCQNGRRAKKPIHYRSPVLMRLTRSMPLIVPEAF